MENLWTLKMMLHGFKMVSVFFYRENGIGFESKILE